MLLVERPENNKQFSEFHRHKPEHNFTEEKIMLVLSRKIGEKIDIGSDIVITVVAVQGNKVRIGIEAPEQVTILRGELTADRPARSEWAEAEGELAPAT